MNSIVNSTIITISKSESLLSELSNDHLSNSTISPYYSCVGSHIRHILDFYDCILKGFLNGVVDLTDRKRDERVHADCVYAMHNVKRIINELNDIKTIDPKTKLTVIDDLGQGKLQIEYTLGALLAQANSHAIHHYAIISYILDRLGILVKDETFGYNPTTPRPVTDLN